MKDRFMQWFVFLVNLDMKYFKEDKTQKKQMYERIRKMRKNKNGRVDKWISKKQ